jgi:hypothetical protein
VTSRLLARSTEHASVERTALSGVDMDGDVDVAVQVEGRLHRALRGYLGAAAHHLGVGLESCTLDLDLPTSAYLALDRRLPEFPDRDVALLWNEVHGWAAAIETHSGEDLIVVSYLDTTTVTPSPRLLARFVHDLRRGGRRFARPDPLALRVAGNHHTLVHDLESATAPTGWSGLSR